MLLASFYGGLCLGPVNTAAGHALAYPLGTRGGLGHGISVALLLPQVLAFNAPARPEKTAEVLQALELDGQDVAEAATTWCKSLGLDMSLAAHGVSEAVLGDWAAEAHAIRRLMDNNPRDMSVSEVEEIYRKAY
jgi:alcohol dehydrogenase class IV